MRSRLHLPVEGAVTAPSLVLCHRTISIARTRVCSSEIRPKICIRIVLLERSACVLSCYRLCRACCAQVREVLLYIYFLRFERFKIFVLLYQQFVLDSSVPMGTAVSTQRCTLCKALCKGQLNPTHPTQQQLHTNLLNSWRKPK